MTERSEITSRLSIGTGTLNRTGQGCPCPIASVALTDLIDKMHQLGVKG